MATIHCHWQWYRRAFWWWWWWGWAKSVGFYYLPAASDLISDAAVVAGGARGREGAAAAKAASDLPPPGAGTENAWGGAGSAQHHPTWPRTAQRHRATVPRVAAPSPILPPKTAGVLASGSRRQEAEFVLVEASVRSGSGSRSELTPEVRGFPPGASSRPDGWQPWGWPWLRSWLVW